MAAVFFSSTIFGQIVVTQDNPWDEGFENGFGSWIQNYVSGNEAWTVTPQLVDGEITDPYEGGFCASFYGTYNCTTQLVSPVLNLSGLDNACLSFWLLNSTYGSSNLTNELKVYYRMSSVGTWNLIADITENHEAWTEIQLTLPHPTASYQIAFEGIGHYGDPIGLDAIHVGLSSPCSRPTAVTVSDITATSAVVSWTPGGTESSWTIKTDGTDRVVYSIPETLTNLVPETEYTVQVRALCSVTEPSDWTFPVTFTTPPTCPAPTQLTCTEIGPNSLTLTWESQGDEEYWIVWANGTETMTNQNPFVLTDLWAVEPYTVKVRAYCGGNDYSHWSDEISTYTGCGPIEITETHEYHHEFVPVTESLIPECWTRDLSFTFNSATYPREEEYYGTLYFYVNSSQSCIISTPEFATPLNRLQVVFNAFSRWSAGDSFYVGIMNDTVFEPLTSVTLAGATQTYWVPLNNYTGDGTRIAFKFTAPNGNAHWAEMENITIQLYEETFLTCPKPHHTLVSNIGMDSVTLSWTPGGEETQWEVVVEDEIDTIVDNPSVTLRGLESGRYYSNVAVRAVCGENDFSVWVPINDFETVCGFLISAMHPYVENFSSYYNISLHPSTYGLTDLPDCWTFLSYVSQSGPYSHLFTNRFYGIVPNDTCLAIEGLYDAITFTCLPVFDKPLNTLDVSFKARDIQGYGSGITFGYMTDAYDSVTFVPLTLCTVDTAVTDIFADFSEFDFPDGARLCLRWSGSTLVIDNVVVRTSDTTGLGIRPYAESRVRIYPNPAIDRVHISIGEEGGNGFVVELFDLSGRRCLSQAMTGSETEVSLSALPTGLYLCRILKNGATITTEKIIKQ